MAKLPEANLTTVCNIICTVCEQPALVCHGPQLPCVRSLELSSLRVSFMSTLRSGSSPSLTAGWAQDYPRMFSLCEIFKYAHLKFTVYGRKQASKHTHAHVQCSPASVGLTQARPKHEIITCLLLMQLY